MTTTRKHPGCWKRAHSVLVLTLAWLVVLAHDGVSCNPASSHHVLSRDGVQASVKESTERPSNSNRRFIVHYEPAFQDAVLGHLSSRDARVVHHMHEHGWVAVHGSEETMQVLKTVQGVTHVELDHPRLLQDCCKAGTFRVSDSTTIKSGKSEVTTYGMWLTQAALKKASDTGGRVSTLGSKVIICVIDSGVDVRHPDFQQNKFTGCTGKTGCPYPWDKDVVGHGTFVTGILSAAQNGIGTVGVIPKGAIIHSVRIFDDTSEAGGPFSSNVVGALNVCEQHLRNLQKKKSGYRMIINMSFGDYNPTKAEGDWFDSRARKGDMMFVAAAGNAGSGTVLYPAAYPAVTSVAAVDCQAQWIYMSSVNRGVDIAAPGSSILSAAPLHTSWSTGTLYADDSTGVTHKVELQNVWGTPATISGRVVLCPSVAAGSNSTACSGVKDKVCLIQLSSWQDLETNLQRCQTGGGKLAIFFDDPAVCIPASKTNVVSSKKRITGGGTMAVTVRTFGDAAVQEAKPIPAIGIDSSDGAMIEAYIHIKRTFNVRLTIRPGGPYQVITGTSGAAPFVTGIAARVWAAHPNCNASAITQAMYSTAMDTMLPGYDTYTGHGLIQAVPFKAKVAKLKCA